MLQGKVDARLISLQARPRAVCAVRERIFSELYDEVVREVSGKDPPGWTNVVCVNVWLCVTTYRLKQPSVKVKQICARQSWCTAHHSKAVDLQRSPQSRDTYDEASLLEPRIRDWSPRKLSVCTRRSKTKKSIFLSVLLSALSR